MATLTITVDAPTAIRVAKAIGSNLNLKDANGDPRNATMEEVTNALRGILRGWVIHAEAKEAAELALVTTGEPVIS